MTLHAAIANRLGMCIPDLVIDCIYEHVHRMHMLELNAEYYASNRYRAWIAIEHTECVCYYRVLPARDCTTNNVVAHARVVSWFAERRAMSDSEPYRLLM